MIKLILIGLLLTFSCQLTISHYHQEDPLDGLTCHVSKSILDMKHLSDINITFADGDLYFEGCNSFATTYKVEGKNKGDFSVNRDDWQNTERACDEQRNDHDEHLKTLFDASAEFKFEKPFLKFYSKKEKILMVLETQ